VQVELREVREQRLHHHAHARREVLAMRVVQHELALARVVRTNECPIAPGLRPETSGVREALTSGKIQG
jgi:hypothetical protein